jgi:hypothetical protein
MPLFLCLEQFSQINQCLDRVNGEVIGIVTKRSFFLRYCYLKQIALESLVLLCIPNISIWVSRWNHCTEIQACFLSSYHGLLISNLIIKDLPSHEWLWHLWRTVPCPANKMLNEVPVFNDFPRTDQ